jgi:hypothetical protein
VLFNAYSNINAGGSDKEELIIYISADGGISWGYFGSYHNATFLPWARPMWDLYVYKGMPNLRFMFKYNDYGGHLYGAALDNIKIFQRNTNEGAVMFVNMPKYSGNGATVAFQLCNYGSAPITSVSAIYEVDNMGPVQETITGLNILPGRTDTVFFSTKLSGIAVTSTPVKLTVNLLMINGANEPSPSDNSAYRYITAGAQTVPRNGLIEEFSTRGCTSCMNFEKKWNSLYVDNKINDTASRVNRIVYMTGWPDANEPAYNAHSEARRSYYNVNDITSHFVNGILSLADTVTNWEAKEEIFNSKLHNSPVTITGVYTVLKDKISCAVDITPHFIPTSPIKVYMIVTERHYNDPAAPTPQKDFYNVARRIIPGANGLTAQNWTPWQTYNYAFAETYNKGNVTKGSFNFWGDPINSDLIVVVQEEASREVLQSLVIPARWPSAIRDLPLSQKLQVFPNPATEIANLSFYLDRSSEIEVLVNDMMGRVIYSQERILASGEQSIQIPTQAMTDGYYNIRLNTNAGSATARMVISK